MRKPIPAGNKQTPFVRGAPIGSPGYEHISKTGKAPPKTPKALPPKPKKK